MISPYDKYEAVIKALRATEPASVVSFPLTAPLVARLDLSLDNPVVAAADIRDNSAITEIVSEIIEQQGARYGVGGYNEKRGWYARGDQFSQGEEVRSIHLGVDVWAPAETPVFSAYDAVIHSAQDNALYGDYGPTVILEHNLNGIVFYTLYGHLSRESLQRRHSRSSANKRRLASAPSLPNHHRHARQSWRLPWRRRRIAARLLFSPLSRSERDTKKPTLVTPRELSQIGGYGHE